MKNIVHTRVTFLLFTFSLSVISCSDSTSDIELFRERLMEYKPVRSMGVYEDIEAFGFYESNAIVLESDARKMGLDVYDLFILSRYTDQAFSRQLQYLMLVTENAKFLDYIRENVDSETLDVKLIKSYVVFCLPDERTSYILEIYELMDAAEYESIMNE